MSVLFRVALLVCALFSMLSPLYPQTVEQAERVQAAPCDLVIQNRKVFTFRTYLGTLSPMERLNLAQSRLAYMPVSDLLARVHYENKQEGILMSVGDHPLFSITSGDLDIDIGQSLESTATRVQSRLQEALEAEASQRSIKNLLHAVIKALAAAIIFLAILVMIGKATRFSKHKITKLAFSKLPKISVGRIVILRPQRVAVLLSLLIRVIYHGIVAIVAYLCITYMLSCFPYTQPWAETLGSALVTLMINLGKTVLHSFPGLFAIAVIAFVTRGLTLLINNIFKSVEHGETTLPWIYQDAAAPTRRIAVALLWIFAIVMAYPYIPGNESIAFKGVSVFIGLLVSFGSAGVVNQAMNGLVIMYARSFKCGDFVKIGEVEGTVSELTLLSTKLHTLRQEEIIIPNSVVIAQTTYNYTRIADERGVGISTSVTVGYDVPWRQVHAMLKMAAEKTDGLGKDPAPYVIQTALANACVEYTLVVHMTIQPNLRQFVKSDLHQNIQDVFNQYGVQLMTSTHIESGIPPVVPEERWYAEPAKKDEAGSSATA
ncbi:MAG: mechanosensitive ion channel family protein [Holophagales bacterium]|jgi:small-conductance mechanosensitive channel|nr:mechanosensitive ion channel family protein [Holophagales bacterium]